MSVVLPATMMLIGFVLASALALWLALVFLADRKPREREERPDSGYLVVVASPGQSAHDKQTEAASGQAATRQETAA
jgi:hypothetical protein